MKTLKSAALLTLLLPTLLLAEEGEHIAVGSHPISEETLLQIQKGRSLEEEESEVETAGNLFNRLPPIYYSEAHHRLISLTVSENGQYRLELEDGSIWKISQYDGAKAEGWLVNDPLIITQNNRWFTKHAYRIINKIKQTSAEATLFAGPTPAPRGMHSRYIYKIDPYRREVVLRRHIDGKVEDTLWEISSLDAALLKDFLVNDYLILGTNSNISFWDSDSDALLINVSADMTPCARAQQKPY